MADNPRLSSRAVRRPCIASTLPLFGAADNPSSDALYGPGGATDPVTGERQVVAKRPGMELVIA
jgi:hypothetical protein